MAIGSILIPFGFALALLAQIAIAVYDFTGNPFKGLLCLFVPFYIVVYAKKNKVGVWLMRCWYAGIALVVIGGVLAS